MDKKIFVGRLRELCRKSRTARGWNPSAKNAAISLCLEASELLEHFQWRNGDELKEYIDTHKEHIGDELADVMYWVLLISNDLGIDISKSLENKIDKNEEKYAVEKAKGNHKKYNEL